MLKHLKSFSGIGTWITAIKNIKIHYRFEAVALPNNTYKLLSTSDKTLLLYINQTAPRITRKPINTFCRKMQSYWLIKQVSHIVSTRCRGLHLIRSMLLTCVAGLHRLLWRAAGVERICCQRSPAACICIPGIVFSYSQQLSLSFLPVCVQFCDFIHLFTIHGTQTFCY
jgi:hypothetical protein